MPEIISKYPEVTLKVLKEAGARCGPEFQPRILTKCPPERFCSLPTGEICVYGLNDIPQMTQISVAEIIQVVSVTSLPIPIPKSTFSAEVLFLIVLAFIVGALLGILFFRRIKKSP